MGVMNSESIGVAIIARNEADRIGRCLRSCAFADAVVVVDSGSTDGTVRLCESLGARVIRHPWSGYAAQKQVALDALATGWILNLDADEAVSPALSREIQQAVRRADAATAGFSMPRLSRYLGRWIRHGGWYPDRKTRLVRRGKGRWSGEALHEKLRVDGRVSPLASPLLHHVYRHISDQVATIDRFSSVYAASRGPADGAFLAAGAIHAVGKFFECFLWKLGVLDGYPGLVIAMNSAWYVFLKHAKRWEQTRKTLP
jgi:glycosyltransferase involved in cell wall biosynthesis